MWRFGEHMGVHLAAGLLLVTRALAPELADWPGYPAP